MSSLKQATLCAVGIVMMKAKRSSMKVLNALYMKARLKRGNRESRLFNPQLMELYQGR